MRWHVLALLALAALMPLSMAQPEEPTASEKIFATDAGSSFPAGSAVLMANGTQKAIEQVRTGDKVRTAEGDVGVVSATNHHKASAKLVKVLIGGKRWGFAATSQTSVLLKRGYFPISRMQKTDEVMCYGAEGKGYHPVHAIETGYEYAGEVYGLTVETNHSYIVNGIGVHNPLAKTFMTGAKKSPRHKLLSAPQHKIVKATPSQWAYVPAKLDMWGNDQYGDCVSAEEAFAKDANGYFIPSDVVVSWAARGGFRDGAMLTDVMDAMKQKGFVVGGQQYNDGGYASVDYSNEATLQNALSQGPVKIGIDSSALPSTAGNQQGWVSTGGRPQQFTNEDHCVGLAGYGPAGWLFQQLHVPLPSGLTANQQGYLLFTWSTIGFVDHSWIMSTCGEAWVRNPTTVGIPPLTPPTPPDPTPPVPPGPAPPNPAVSVTITYADMTTQTLPAKPDGLVLTGGTTAVELMEALNRLKDESRWTEQDRVNKAILEAVLGIQRQLGAKPLPIGPEDKKK